MNKEKDNSKELELLIGFLLIPAFCYYKIQCLKFAQKSDVWTSLRMSPIRKPYWTVFLTLIVAFLNLICIGLSINQRFTYATFVYLLNLICQIPLARIYLFYEMNKAVKLIPQGTLDPITSLNIRKARQAHGASYAELSFTSENRQVPKNYIGKRVEPHDQPIPIFGEPKCSDTELGNLFVGDVAVFPLNAESPDHHLVIGQTGSGKTTLITRMVNAALNENWKVVVIDLKGDPTDITKFLSIEADQSKVVHFPTYAFDFWKGSLDEIAERVISFFPNDGEPFYLNRNSFAVHAVITRSDLPAPQSADELIDRLRKGLKYSRNESDFRFFSAKERGVEIGEWIANDVSTYLDPIRNVENKTPYRFHWSGNWKLSLFTLDGFEPSALRIADSVLHDFASWIFSDERASSKTPILLIIDEASAFSALPRIPILSALIQRARSARVSLVFASQNLSAFRDEKDNLLHSGAIRWLGSSSQVSEMVEAAGTRSVIESGFQFMDSDYSGTVTHRSQKEFKIDPDFVKELRTFHWFVSSRGRVSSVYVPPLGWEA